METRISGLQTQQEELERELNLAREDRERAGEREEEAASLREENKQLKVR